VIETDDSYVPVEQFSLARGSPRHSHPTGVVSGSDAKDDHGFCTRNIKGTKILFFHYHHYPDRYRQSFGKRILFPTYEKQMVENEILKVI